MSKPQTLTPRQQERRQRILSATRELVAQHGYDGMIMRDVAAQADVSATTLYNLYNTKDELLLEALREEVTRSNQHAREETQKPGYAYLLRHLHHVAKQTRGAPAYVMAISQALLRAKEGDPLVVLLLNGLRDDVYNSLLAMVEQEEVEPKADLETIAVALSGAFWAGFLLWSKGIIELEALESTLMRNYLSLLIPISRGETRSELEARYQALE